MRFVLKVVGWTIASLVLSLPIAVVMSDQDGRAIAQETASERKARGDRLLQQGIEQAQISQFAAALQSWHQALQIYRSIKDQQGEGNALGNLGSTYYSLGNYTKAIEYYQKALAIFQKTKNRQSEGKTLRNLGNAYYNLEDHTRAIECYERSLVFLQEMKDSEIEQQLLLDLGDAYFSISDYTKAIEYYQQNLATARVIKDQESEVTTLGRLGNVYLSLGSYAKAIEYYQRQLITARNIRDQAGEGIALGGLGIVYFSLGNYTKAIDYQEQRLAIVQKINDRRGEGAALGGLGVAYYSLGNYTKAIDYQEQRLAIAQKINDQRGEGTALGNLGIIYNDLGKYDKAIGYYKQSLVIARNIKNRHSEGQALGNLGIIYSTLGKNTEALDYQEQSLVLAQNIKDRVGERNALINLGKILFVENRPEFAETKLLKAVEIEESLRTGLADDQRRSLFEAQIKTYRILQQVQISLQKIESALESADRGRARAFIELLAARFAGETLENAIAKQKVEKLSLPQIQQVAKTQTATLVQYSIVSNTDLYIYIVQPNGSISFRKAAMSALGKSLNDFVNASRSNLGVRDRGDIVVSLTPEKQQELREQRDRALRQLHQLLIEPIADLLPKNENDRVIFMPQGELFLVPFPALLNAQNQPLITQHTILTAPSIQTLDLTHKTAQSLPKGNRPALVVGNPAMPAVTTIIGNPPHKLSNLPGSETEAKAIAKQLNTQAITGDSAKKDAIVQKMQQAGIIHLATHGLLDSFKGDTPGAIALAPNGTNQANDGLLTSGEIFDLKLNANLVVLSACDTGRGDITGDGVIGLSRSLFVAGVPSVIVSLWKVPDDSTAFLMTEFYRNWRERKLDKAQALRQAMLSTRNKYPQPLNWAAFTLIGEAE